MSHVLFNLIKDTDTLSAINKSMLVKIYKQDEGKLI